MLIAQRILYVFIADEFCYFVFYTHGGHILVIVSAQSRIKKIFQLINAMRRLHVFAIAHAADGRNVHLHLIGDFFKHHWLEKTRPSIKKFKLNFHDALHDPYHGDASLVNRIDKPACGIEFFNDEFFGLSQFWITAPRFVRLAEQGAINWADAQFG